MSAELVKDLVNTLSPSYILQGRMIARVRYFRVNDMGEPTEELFLYFSSPPPTTMDNGGEEWYNSHSRRIIELIDTMNRNSSNIEFDSIERVYIKLVLHDNVSGQGVFTLPPKLAKKRQVIVNVNTVSECFKYALLSILHYNDVASQ